VPRRGSRLEKKSGVREGERIDNGETRVLAGEDVGVDRGRRKCARAVGKKRAKGIGWGEVIRQFLKSELRRTSTVPASGRRRERGTLIGVKQEKKKE